MNPPAVSRCRTVSPRFVYEARVEMRSTFGAPVIDAGACRTDRRRGKDPYARSVARLDPRPIFASIILRKGTGCSA